MVSSLFSQGIYVTRISPKGPADLAGLKMGDKIMQVCSEMKFFFLNSWSTRWCCVPQEQCCSDFHFWYLILFILFQTKFLPSFQVNGWDMTMVTHDQARKKLTKKREDVVRLLVTRKSLEEAVKQSKGCYPKP